MKDAIDTTGFAIHLDSPIYYSSADRSSIDMEIDHPLHGRIPITINAAEYPDLWAHVLSGTTIAPYPGQ